MTTIKNVTEEKGKKEKKKVKSLNGFLCDNKTINYNRGGKRGKKRKRKNIQKNLQNKSKNNNNKCFHLFACF